MASGIAHEINNPLTWVIGYSELLLDRDLPEAVHNDIQAVYEGSMRMASIIQRMLAFARRNEPEYAVVQMNDLVEETLKLRSHDMKVNNIDVMLNCAPDLPEIFVDGSQIQQVFLNIILNAEIEMKKAHNGGTLTITTESMAGGLRVTFTDDGPGIPEDDMERLFEPFFTTREVGEGTGLGLSVSYGIVSRHGGRIYARSTPGQGASFIVELPFRETSAEPPAETDNRPQVPAGTRILVVDDESLIRNYLSDLLKLEQCVVTTAESGMKALELIHRQKFDVVMLDVKMPGMTGIELYEKLKEEADDMAGKVIFVTGDLMSSETMSFVVNSTIPFVAKPFDAEQIMKTIHRVVSG
jgi:CheY-like chemotaxis protein